MSNIPNTDTIEAIKELENKEGTLFSGSTEDLFSELIKDSIQENNKDTEE